MIRFDTDCEKLSRDDWADRQPAGGVAAAGKPSAHLACRNYSKSGWACWPRGAWFIALRLVSGAEAGGSEPLGK